MTNGRNTLISMRMQRVHPLKKRGPMLRVERIIGNEPSLALYEDGRVVATLGHERNLRRLASALLDAIDPPGTPRQSATSGQQTVPAQPATANPTAKPAPSAPRPEPIVFLEKAD